MPPKGAGKSGAAELSASDVALKKAKKLEEELRKEVEDLKKKKEELEKTNSDLTIDVEDMRAINTKNEAEIKQLREDSVKESKERTDLKKKISKLEMQGKKKDAEGKSKLEADKKENTSLRKKVSLAEKHFLKIQTLATESVTSLAGSANSSLDGENSLPILNLSTPR